MKYQLFIISLIIATGVGLVSSQQQLGAAANCTTLTSKPNVVSQKYTFQNCIIAQFGFYLNLGDGKFVQFDNGTVNANLTKCHAEAVNSTHEVQPVLTVDFPCGQLVLNFQHTADPKNAQKTFVKPIEGKFKTSSNGTDIVFGENTTQFFATTQSGHYYKCNSEQSFKIVLPGYPNASMSFSNVALEAYKTTAGTDFYSIAEECALDSQPVSDLVRIGVGICLVALVAIVLVAYFIGRRRWSERSSYESV